MQASSAGILASALGHGLAVAAIIWLGGGAANPAPGPRPLVVALLTEAPPVEAAPTASVRTERRRKVSPPPPVADRPPPVADRPRPVADGAAGPGPARPPLASPSPAGAAALLPAEPAAAGPGPGPAPAASATTARPGGHEDAVAAYAARLWAAVARHRPRGVGLSGTALVLVEVGDDGALQHLAIDRSSGDARLDERALATVRAAAPFPTPPPGLDTAERKFLIPFAFR
jgi:protein TonB